MLKVSLPPHWGALVPGQQHTFLGGMVMSHEFESLVRLDSKGILEPAVAKSWKVNNDFSEYRFEIDTSKRFSDGTPLTATNVKNSWERSLQLEKKSTNHSLLDLMYLVEGYEDFAQTGALSGVKVLSNSQLVVKFKRPFRLALDQFAGVRYAVFRKSGDGELVGTGAYRMIEKGEDQVVLERNPYHPDVDESPRRIEVRGQGPEESVKELLSGTTDLIQMSPFSSSETIKEYLEEIELYKGQESTHLILVLNGIEGRTLSNPSYRQALQYIIASEIAGDPEFLSKMAPGFRVDSQSYLPVQAGRLEEDDANEIIGAGRSFVERLRAASRDEPLQIFSGSSGQWIKKILDKYSIAYQEVSSSRDAWEMFFKTFEPDVFLYGFSVMNGDPDTLYHTLGPNGSISTKMAFRDGVMNQLEEGRSILDRDQLHKHYTKVNRAILSEVPYIHIGFLRKVYAYKKGQIGMKESLLHRRDYDLSSFVRVDDE